MSQLPGVRSALVSPDKITGYLLSTSSKKGAPKARFFYQHGFGRENWQALAEALREHALHARVYRQWADKFGQRYDAVGPLTTPSGRTIIIVSGWIIGQGSSDPRLITAYGAEKNRIDWFKSEAEGLTAPEQ